MLEHSWKLGFYETNIWSPWFIDLYDYVCTYVCMCVHKIKKKKSIIMDTSVQDIGAAVLIMNNMANFI